ncbi:zinc finger MYM-type protein 1-like, partial [Aphis craccivora]
DHLNGLVLLSYYRNVVITPDEALNEMVKKPRKIYLVTNELMFSYTYKKVNCLLDQKLPTLFSSFFLVKIIYEIIHTKYLHLIISYIFSKNFTIELIQSTLKRNIHHNGLSLPPQPMKLIL